VSSILITATHGRCIRCPVGQSSYENTAHSCNEVKCMHSGRVFLLHFKSFRLAYPLECLRLGHAVAHRRVERLFQGVYSFRLPTATLYTIRKKKRVFLCFTPPENEFGNQLFLDSRFLVDFSTFFTRTSSYESKKVSATSFLMPINRRPEATHLRRE